jgi:hypothetical protein
MVQQNKRSDYLVLEKPVITNKNTVICGFESSPGIQQTFKGNTFFASYGDIDLTSVPESLLIIPALASLAPIAWARNATVYVPKLDSVFFDALQAVKKSLQIMHPRISWTGEVQPESLVTTRDYPSSRSALLFSGGIDSLTSYVVHQNEKPLLVSVLGPDRNSIEFNLKLKELSSFSSKQGSRFTPVCTNMESLFVAKHLPFGGGWWWTRVQHGLAYLGLCAPLSPVEQIGRIYLASTHTRESQIPWGSHPSIDNNVTWASTTAQHDCYHLSRQEKIKILATYIRAENPQVKIRICYQGPDHTNCSQCGKCCRTIIGLAAVGIDPNLHGFHCDAHKLADIRYRLSHRKFLLDANNLSMWKDIQKNLPGSPSLQMIGLNDFFTWFENFPL